jgi:TonB family protein
MRTGIWKKITRRGVSLRYSAYAILAAFLLVLAVPGHAETERAVKSRVAPVYPEIAKRMRVSGLVTLRAIVDPKGKVTDVKPVSGNQMLSMAAQEAVYKWRFEPGPAESTVTVQINFAPPE